MKTYAKVLAIFISVACIHAIHASEPGDHGNDGSHDRDKNILTCEERIKDFGIVSGDVIEATFTVTNASQSTIILDSIQKTCKCTTARIVNDTIAPGDSTFICVVSDLKNRVQKGKFEISVLACSSTNKEANILLVCKGVYADSVEVLPNRVSFINIPQDKVASTTLKIFALDKSIVDFKVLDTTSDSEYIKAWISPREPGAKGWHSINIETVGNIPLGYRQSKIDIKTDIEGYETISVPCYLMGTEKVSVYPESIELMKGCDGSSIPTTRYLSVVSQDREEFSIEKVECDHEDIDCAIEKDGTGKYIIRVSNILIDPNSDKRNVIINTDVPGFESITIPIRVN